MNYLKVTKKLHHDQYCPFQKLPSFKKLAIDLKSIKDIYFYISWVCVYVYWLQHMFLILKAIFPIWITVYGALDKILIGNGGEFANIKFTETSNYLSINKYPSNYRVWLSWSWFLIHGKVLNFHNWILCYHEPFSRQDKKIKIELSMDLWHLNNMKVILTHWTLIYGDCVSFLY